MLVLEFRNEDFSHIELAVFAKKAVQDNICVYPHLKTDCNYEITGEGIRSGTDITENGIDFPINVCYTTHFKTLSRCVSIRTRLN
ncbi:MAG: hypothetical protein J6B23_03865 [Clostridia bacterium]|nr:hypothetical protein [Clostridia bacterium]